MSVLERAPERTVSAFRLSPRQAELWPATGGRAPISQCLVRLAGPLRTEELRQAVEELPARHELLRSRFVLPRGADEAVRTIEAHAQVEWRSIDARDLHLRGEAGDGGDARRLARRADLPSLGADRLPVLQAVLAARGQEDHLLLLRTTALHADARSLDHLVGEVARAYGGEAGGTAESLPYARYAEWQRGLLAAPEAAGEREAWKRLLDGAGTIGESPSGEPDPDASAVPLPPRTARRLERLAQELGAGVEDLLLAAWQSLLWRLDDRAPGVGALSEGRKVEPLAGSIGLFARHLPLGLRPEPGLPFRELVRRVRAAWSEARRREEYFTRDLVPGLHAGVGAVRPVWPALFEAYRDAGSREARGVRFSILHREARLQSFGLKLSMVVGAGRLDLLLERSGARRSGVGLDDLPDLASRLLRLLEAVLTDPGTPLARIDLLGRSERHQLLAEWQGEALAGAWPAPLSELFREQARRRPDGVAVAGDEILSFAEVERRSGRLAVRLRALGVGAEDRIALLLPRHPDLLVAAIAVLRAGAVVVPLDPAQPAKRLDGMLERARPAVLVTREELAEGLSEGPFRTLLLDRSAGSPGEGFLGAVAIDPAQAAYGIFTSGSTGPPKLVLVPHAAAAHLVDALSRTLRGEGQAEGGLRQSLNAPLAFDGAVKQLLQLMAGHALHLVPEEVRRDASAFVAWLGERRLDVLDSTPAQLRLLVGAGLAEELGAPAAVLVGGEAIDDDLWAELATAGGVAFWNLYGPTECTVDAAGCRVDAATGPHVGRPLPRVRAYVADRSLALRPVGFEGELCLAGAGVSRGYAGDPGATAERFVPDPFRASPAEPGGRLYRTGDRARFGRDGRLRVLGRLDRQVQVRGIRVEPGEIESVLRGHPAVRDAVVTAEADRGESRLTGYWGPARAGGPTAAELQVFLRERLPSYMVPGSLVALREIPLTPNGKIDLAALAGAERVEERPESPLRAPRTPFEEAILELWKELLPGRRIGVDDEFFELGGHSLLATRLLSRVRALFGVEIPLSRLFEEPALHRLAAAVEAAAAGRGNDPAVAEPIPRAPREGEIPLSFAQQRLWVIHQLEPSAAAYNVVGALRLAGSLSVTALEQAIGEIVRRHEVLRTRYPAALGRPRQEIVPAVPLALPVIDPAGTLPAGDEDRLRSVVREPLGRAFDIDGGSPFRALLFRLSPEEHVLGFAVHHIAADGWSIGVVVRELAALYRAAVDGRPSPLAELPVQYADFAAWQRGEMSGETLDRHLVFWRRQLAGTPPRLELPADRTPGVTRSGRGAVRSQRLPTAVADGLRELARENGATLFMVLLAAFQLQLARITGQRDLVVGTDLAGRGRVELEPLVGFFINVLPVRGRLEPRSSFEDLVRAVRATALAVYAHGGLPFDKLVEELAPERSASGVPLIQVLFVMQNTPQEELRLPGCVLSPFRVEQGWSKFDLALFVGERPDGIEIRWTFPTDVFEPATVDRMAADLSELIDRIVARPKARLDELGLDGREKWTRTVMETKERRTAKLNEFLEAGPRGGDARRARLVDFAPPGAGDSRLPTYRPATGDLDPFEWAADRRDEILESLLEHGALRFRGFDLPSVDDFERFAAVLCPDLFEEYGDLPREGSSDRVYHSTPYPEDKWILFHNESSHMHRWPMKQFFYCVRMAPEGGETPLLDCREVRRRLDPSIVDGLRERKVVYVRNFSPGFDVSWQDFFRTDDREAVERYCERAGIEVEWKPDGGLRTRQEALAVARHPVTGEEVFFNQLQLHHPASLEPEVRESLTALFGPEELPRNVLYGDGTPIETEVLEEIGALYQELAVVEPWREGDVLMLDNMMTAHARKPFSGPRKIVVAMGEVVTRQEVDTAAAEAGAAG